MTGRVLGGRYRLDETISLGGVGEVWRCVDEHGGRTVAAKVMATQPWNMPGFGNRVCIDWTREMAAIDHSGVVKVYDSGVDTEVGIYVIMEYVEGHTLHGLLGKRGPLTPSRTMELVAQTADALQAIHDRGLLHGDLRPGRILVRPDQTIVLSVFGLEDQVGYRDPQAGPIGGLSYLAPERHQQGEATHLSDIYALGVVAYECLAGRQPFVGTNWYEIVLDIIETEPPRPPAVPDEIWSIMERAMAKEPAARWPTAGALAGAALAAR